MIDDSEYNAEYGVRGEIYTLDFTAPAEGDYLIFVSLMGTTTTQFAVAQFFAELDDSIELMSASIRPTNTNRDLDYVNHSCVYVAESLSAGSHYIDIDAYGAGGPTMYHKQCKIIVVRIDDWLPTSGMYDYQATEGEYSPASANTFYDVQSITFTPDQAGDYLILASIEVKSGSTSYSASCRINYDSGSEYMPLENTEESGETWCTHECNSTSQYLSWVWGGIVSIPASSKTIAINVEGGSTSWRARKRRLIAIRLGALSGDEEHNEVTTVASTTSQWTDKGTLTFTPGSTIDFLILGVIVIKPDSTIYPSHARLTQTAGTGTGDIALMNRDSKDSSGDADAFPLFTAHIKELATISQTFKTQIGYANASGTTWGKCSVIVIIPVEGGGAPPPAADEVIKKFNENLNGMINNGLN
jgi:hypothetical protein